MVNKSELADMVPKETKAATELPIISSLNVTAKSDVGTLSMWNEELVFGQKAIEFPEAPAYIGTNEDLIVNLWQNKQILCDILVCKLQV